MTLISLSGRAWKFIRWLPRNVLNGLRFRVFFFRGTDFKVPSSIHVADQTVSLYHLNEPGVAPDFIDCFIQNVYGLGKQLGKVQTVIDIGANSGFFSLAARGHYPKAVIHAYEPNPRIQPILHANTQELAIVAYPEAVGGTNCRVSLNDGSVSNMARTFHSKDEPGSINQIGLDLAIERIGGVVDLLKLDCEGAEWEMFQISDCWKSVKNIRMEYHLYNGESVEQVVRSLSGLGFQIIHMGPHLNNIGIVWGKRD